LSYVSQYRECHGKPAGYRIDAIDALVLIRIAVLSCDAWEALYRVSGDTSQGAFLLEQELRTAGKLATLRNFARDRSQPAAIPGSVAIALCPTTFLREFPNVKIPVPESPWSEIDRKP
jgi:hypothetical protein